MTRDADIARIAAVLYRATDGLAVDLRPRVLSSTAEPRPYIEDLAAALYDAGLRPSVEPGETTDFASDAEWAEGWQRVAMEWRRRAVEAEDALTAVRPSVEPAGLDVERLARAIAAVGQSYMDQKVREWEPDWIALRIAAEYAALPPEASDSPEKPT